MKYGTDVQRVTLEVEVQGDVFRALPLHCGSDKTKSMPKVC